MQFSILVRSDLLGFAVLKIDDIGTFGHTVIDLHLKLQRAIPVILPVVSGVISCLRFICVIEAVTEIDDRIMLLNLLLLFC